MSSIHAGNAPKAVGHYPHARRAVSYTHLDVYKRQELHPAPAAGRGRLYQPVELAAVSVHLEDRAGVGGWQHGGRQTL